MEYLVIGLASLLVSGVTLWSGFGLGTLLTPVFAMFFPLSLAVAATAVVHLANNLFKLGLLAHQADRDTLLRFGVPAAVAALVGAGLLSWLDQLPQLLSYELGESHHQITLVKAVIGSLIILFALLEFSSRFQSLALSPRYLPLGGMLSGFFGGLSGNQGALRSAFLLKAGLSKEAFVATGVVAAVMVDGTRLGVYGVSFLAEQFSRSQALLLPIGVATLCAFSGALLGKRLLRKVKLRTVQLAAAGMLFVVGLGLVTGLL